MKTDRIEIVQSTFALVRGDADRVAELFYARLFELAPQLRPMFRGDMQSHGRKLRGALALAVDGVTRLEELLPALEAMGQRHAQYGVRDEHYAIVGTALLDTLRLGLGAAFTPAARDAWAETYWAVAEAMQRGAYLATVQQPALHLQPAEISK